MPSFLKDKMQLPTNFFRRTSVTSTSRSDLTPFQYFVSAATKESYYPLEFDVESFKNNFADILATLELAKTKKSSNWLKAMMGFLGTKTTKYAGRAAAFVLAILGVVAHN